MPTDNHRVNHYSDGTSSALRKTVDYKQLRFFQRSEVLYQLTRYFCDNYLPKYGDRTVDQMVQAARSIKQNIAEGITDGEGSVETEIKLLGIARGSGKELLEDYLDYLKYHDMEEWHSNNPRFTELHAFCKEHTSYDAYKPLFPKMKDGELANMAICLCHQIDKGLASFIQKVDRDFTQNGGVREQMTRARLEQRARQTEIIKQQSQEIERLKEIIKKQSQTQ